MKKIFFTLFFTVITTAVLQAQQISVVSSVGATKLYNTLQEAIEGADPGSVIYLPGGGFNISDNVKITKKLTIIGIGYKANTDNVDGSTTIGGNLYFNEGSSGSAVMGCYISGTVSISANNVLVKCCNINYVWVSNSCVGTYINQNYIRSTSWFNGASVYFSNNIAHSLFQIHNGTISNNIMFSTTSPNGSTYKTPLDDCSNSIIKENVLFDLGYGRFGSNIQTYSNLSRSMWGDNAYSIGNTDWSDVFETGSYHFKGDYKQYESKVGIYAGTGFKDSGMAPVPYIVSKQIPEQTDASGKLNIKIRVKAGE